ncbi:MAG TPA: bifunctional YncE family protein/alkaline phosphatase family protein [Thermoanaerobaculia bacterium]|nr:bifunctional YncE family protein/alkaline phosphatase family protein [Thermoanaerobaculia bacterium]
MENRKTLGAAVAALVLATGTYAQQPSAVQRPGVAKGETLLPNGWRIAPAGKHVSVGDLPLAMVESADGRYAIVANNGYQKPSLTVVDLRGMSVAQRVPLDSAWLGLAWHPDGQRLYCSGSAANVVYELAWKDGKLSRTRTLSLGAPEEGKFVGGIAVHPDGKRLYAVNPLGQSLTAIDLDTGQPIRTVALDAEPYTCLVSRDGRTLYVSLWGGSKVVAFDADTLEKRGELATGEHPAAMAESPGGRRLFVACANTNSAWVLDPSAGRAEEQILVSLFPNAPPGSTPNAIALSEDGRRLLVANADNNVAAVVDVSERGRSRSEGFIPTGWYPTAVSFDRAGKRIFVLSGKGLSSQANPRGPQPGVPAESQYIGGLLTGSLSILPVPDPGALAAYTRSAYRLSRYRDETRLTPASAPKGSPIPAKVGQPSPIRHVFYVIRENRTYDQILGDEPSGNGAPDLCLFGADVTPNAHALAREFVLLDNFYVDAEVSYDGHSFSTAAYATDATEKMWPQNYGRNEGRYLSEGGGPNRNPYGNLTAPSNGYIWDACHRAGMSVRSYGEFAVPQREAEDGKAGEPPYRGSVPGLGEDVSPDYPPFDLSIPDARRVDVWLKEFREFEQNGKLPRISIFHLGDDHTAGTRAGFPTPTAMIAENDAALGRIVDAISHSRYWKESAIFVLEDDAQNGPDHVDAHRSVALVASPWTRRGAVDSTLYTTSAMLRTIELILGLPPMSQYDAAATPMYRSFQSKPDLRPFDARPARVPTDERNASTAYGAEESAAMDFAEADEAPDEELNEIIWRSVRGADSPMPPPVRSAFVSPHPTPDR